MLIEDVQPVFELGVSLVKDTLDFVVGLDEAYNDQYESQNSAEYRAITITDKQLLLQLLFIPAFKVGLIRCRFAFIFVQH